MVAWELSGAHLLALAAANLEPLACCSDSRWRSITRHFPASGVGMWELQELGAERLIEFCPGGVIVTERGRRLFSEEGWLAERGLTPAKLGAKAPELSVH